MVGHSRVLHGVRQGMFNDERRLAPPGNIKSRVAAAAYAMLAGIALSLFLPPAAQAIVGTAVAADSEQLTWLKAGDFKSMERYFSGLQRSYEAGHLSDKQLYQGFRSLYQDDDTNAPYFDHWVKAYPKSYSARLARGAYWYRMGWAARGNEFIDNTPPERIARMEDYFAKSRPDLTDSLKLTAKPYLSVLYLLNVEILDGSADARRHWLDLGTSIDPNNSLLRMRYMFSLQPRWGGSIDVMAAFFNECVRRNAPAATLAELRLSLASEMAEALPTKTSQAERLGRWNEVIELAQAAGEPPPPQALAAYARSAWDLNRRDEADRSLARLAQLDVSDAWTLSQMAWIYVHEQRMAEGWAVLTRAAALNDAWSQFAVGKTLVQGCPEIKLTADRVAGRLWIQRSADQGFAEAIAYLATLDK